MKKIIKRISFFILGVTIILLTAIYFAFFDMVFLPKGTLIAQSSSSDGTYTVRAYQVIGGTTVSDSIRAELIFNNSNRMPKNIYWNYRESQVVIDWIDDDTVLINGVELDVPHEKFDFRNQ